MIFPALYLLYFSIGLGISVKWFGGEIPADQWFYYLTGLIFFIAGMLLPIVASRSLGQNSNNLSLYGRPKVINRIWKSRNINKFALTIFIIGSLFMLVVIFQRGLPFFSDVQARRFGEAHRVSGYFLCVGLLVQISVIFFIFSGCLKKKLSYWMLIVIILGTLMVGFYGSRAQLVPIFMTFLLCSHYLRKNFTFRKVILLGVTGLLLFFSFGFLRVEGSIDWYKDYLEEKNYPKKMWLFGPGYLSIRAPIDSFAIILNKIPRRMDFWYGRMLISPFMTLLPGKQFLGQYTVTDKIIKGDSRISGPTALSFFVPFYIDFGIIGIICGMFFAGAFLQWLYLRMIHKRREIDYLLYFIVLSNYCIWIYGGFFPTLIVVWQLLVLKFADFFIRTHLNHRRK